MITPRDFPTSAYAENLPSNILSGFEHVKSSGRESEDAQVKNFYVHEYRKNLGDRRLLLTIESHSKLWLPGDMPPTNFYYMTFEIR